MISGATALMLPSMMQPKEIMNVAMSGRRGSPLPWKNLRAGIRLSLAIACSSRGAPVSDCRPAPSEDDADADEPIVERDRRRQEQVRLQGVTLGDGAKSRALTR